MIRLHFQQCLCGKVMDGQASSSLLTLMYYSKQAASQLLFTTSKISICSSSVTLILYPEPIAGRLAVKQEFRVADPYTPIVSGGKLRTQRKPAWIQGEHSKLCADRNPSSGSNLLKSTAPFCSHHPLSKLRCQKDLSCDSLEFFTIACIIEQQPHRSSVKACTGSEQTQLRECIIFKLQEFPSNCYRDGHFGTKDEEHQLPKCTKAKLSVILF